MNQKLAQLACEANGHGAHGQLTKALAQHTGELEAQLAALTARVAALEAASPAAPPAARP
jgi:hypothetical protein